MVATPPALQNLIIVACHAPFKNDIETVPAHPERDDVWVLQPFQQGEPPLYIEHIRHGVSLLERNPAALLVFSGGYTRKEAGLRWSEADTYAAIARHFNWWRIESNDRPQAEFSSRVATEDFSRDSFENLLFSICRFQQITGHYPREVTVVSWAFKQARFDLHRAAIRFPSHRFHFEGANQPVALDAALKGEAETLRQFGENKYGSAGKLAEKRAARNPFKRRHDFAKCPGMQKFFDFIDRPENGQKDFPELLPWER